MKANWTRRYSNALSGARTSLPAITDCLPRAVSGSMDLCRFPVAANSGLQLIPTVALILLVVRQ